MSKKAEPIWECVPRRKLIQKQKEYYAFWSEMPHSTERLFLIDTYQSPKLSLDGKSVENLKPGGKAIRKKYKQYYEEWQVIWLDVWKKKYCKFGDEMNNKLIEAQTEYVNEVFEYQDLSVLPEDSDVSHILEAITFLEENHPGSSNKAIQELALLLTKQYDGALFKTIEKEFRSAPQRKSKSESELKVQHAVAQELFNEMFEENQKIRKRDFWNTLESLFNNRKLWHENGGPCQDTAHDWYDKFMKNKKIKGRP